MEKTKKVNSNLPITFGEYLTSITTPEELEFLRELEEKKSKCGKDDDDS